MNNRQYDDYFYSDYETDAELLERKFGNDKEWWDKYYNLTDEEAEIFISELNDTLDANIDHLFERVTQSAIKLIT